MGGGVNQLPEAQGDLIGRIEGEFDQLRGEVFDSVKLNVLDELKLTEVVLKSEDFANGKLKPENFDKIREELKTKVDGVDLRPVLAAAKIEESFDVQPVKDFFVERALKNLDEKIEKELTGYTSFTQVTVVPKDLLQFDLKVEGGVKKVEAGTVESKPTENGDDLTKAEKEKRLANEADEKAKIKTALGKAGFFGWIASKLLFGERKDKDGNPLPSYIDEAYANPDSVFGSILGLFGVPRFEESWKKMANPEGMPPQVKGFFENIERAVSPYRGKVKEALGEVGDIPKIKREQFVKDLEAGKFAKNEDFKEALILAEPLDFIRPTERKVMVQLPPNSFIEMTEKGAKYLVKSAPDKPFGSSEVVAEGGSKIGPFGDKGGVVYIGELPAGTKFPAYTTITLLPN